MSKIILEIDDDLKATLDEFCNSAGEKPDEFIRESLRRQLSLARFDALRAKAVPIAEAQGIKTDEDVFRVVS